MAGSVVWLDVLPSMAKFGSQMAKSAGSAARTAGVTAGKQFSAGLSAGSAGGAGASAMVKELDAAAKKATRIVNQEKTNIYNARNAEKAAAQGVAAAEARLAEQRTKFGAASSQALKAEQALTVASGKRGSAVLKTVAVEDQLKAAYAEQKVVTTQLTSAQSASAKQTALSTGKLSKLASVGGSVDSGMRKAASGIKTAAAGAVSAVKPLVSLASGMAAIASVGGIISIGNEYTKTMNTLRAVTDATGTQMAALSKKSKTLGADIHLPATSAKDAASVMLELSKAGFSVQQAMDAAKGTIVLASAAQIDGAQAAEIQSNAMNQFGLKATDASRVADILANTANAASGDITDFALSMKYVGAASKAVGVDLQSTSAALGVLANRGIKGEQAGTSLRSMLTSLASPTKAGTTALKKLGVQAFDSKGNFVGLRDVIGQLSEAQKKMSQKDFLGYVKKAFGKETLSAVSDLAAAGVEGSKGYDAMYKAVGRSGGAAKVANANMQGFGGALDKLESQMQDVALTIYEQVAPGLTKATTSIAKWLSGTQGKMESFLKTASGFAKLSFTGKISADVKGIDPKVVSGIQAARTVIIGAFKDIWSFITDSLVPSFKNLMVAVGPLTAVLGGILLLAFRLIAATLKDVVGPALVAVTGFMRKHKSIAFILAGVLGGLVLAYKAYNLQIAIAKVGLPNYIKNIRIVAAAQKTWAFATWLMTGAMAALNAVLDANLLGIIIIAIAALVAGVIYAYTHFKWFRDIVQVAWKVIQAATLFAWEKVLKPTFKWISDAVNNTGKFFTWLWQDIIVPAWDGISGAFQIAWDIIKAIFDGIATAVIATGDWFAWFGGMVADVAKAIASPFVWLWNTILKPIFDGFAAVFTWFGQAFYAVGDLIVHIVQFEIAATWTWLYNAVIKPIGAAIGLALQTVGGFFTWLWQSVIVPVWKGIGSVITTVATTLNNVFATIGRFVTTVVGAAFTWLYNTVILPVWNAIGAVISRVHNVILVPVFNTIGSALHTVGAAFTWLYNTIIKPVWNGISGVVGTVWNKGIKPIFDALKSWVTKDIPNAFNTMKDAVGKAWNAVSDVAKAPIRFLVNTILDDALIGNFNKVAKVFHSATIPEVKLPKGFAGGGVLPGYQSAKRDELMVPMRKGEGVLVPEVVRALGPQFVHTLNAAGNSGGVGSVRKLAGNGYASGGIVGSAWDWVKNAAQTAASVVSDPVGTLGTLVKSMIGKIPGAGVMVGAASGAGTKLLDYAVSSLKTLAGSVTGSGGGSQANPTGSGVTRWTPNVIQALAANGLSTSDSMVQKVLRQIQSESGGNPNATQHGYTDVNTLSGDLAKGLMQTISATFNAYKFPGHGDIFNGYDNLLAALNYAKNRYGANLNGLGEGHGYGEGGVIPTLYDDGGVLPRGVSVIANKTKDPEYALPESRLVELMGKADKRDTTVNNWNITRAVDADSFYKEFSRRSALGAV